MENSGPAVGADRQIWAGIGAYGATCVCEYHAVSDDGPALIRLDPESEACVPLIVEIIAEEISARLAVRDTSVDDPAWAARLAKLAADSLLDRFQVRQRSSGEPRYDSRE